MRASRGSASPPSEPGEPPTHASPTSRYLVLCTMWFRCMCSTRARCHPAAWQWQWHCMCSMCCFPPQHFSTRHNNSSPTPPTRQPTRCSWLGVGLTGIPQPAGVFTPSPTGAAAPVSGRHGHGSALVVGVMHAPPPYTHMCRCPPPLTATRVPGSAAERPGLHTPSHLLRVLAVACGRRSHLSSSCSHLPAHCSLPYISPAERGVGLPGVPAVDGHLWHQPGAQRAAAHDCRPAVAGGRLPLPPQPLSGACARCAHALVHVMCCQSAWGARWVMRWRLGCAIRQRM